MLSEDISVQIVNQTNSILGPTACVFGNGVFIVTTNYGLIFSSTDGITWTKVYSNPTDTFSYAFFADGTFNVVGGTGNKFRLLTSSDATTWTGNSIQVLSSAVTNTSLICHGNGTYAIYVGAIYTSTDGVLWTHQSSNYTAFSALNRFTYVNGTFFLLGQTTSSSVYLLTSPDGVTYTAPTLPSTTSTFASDVIWDGTQFIVACSKSVMISPDGVTWTDHPYTGITAASTSKLCFGGGQYLLFATNSPSSTTDPTTWAQATNTAMGATATAMASYGNSTFALITGTGISNYPVASTDLTSFTTKASSFIPSWVSNNQKFLTDGTHLYFYRVLGSSLTWDQVSSSDGGVTWTTAPTNLHALFTAITGWFYSNGKFFASGTASGATNIASSTDGVTFSLASSFPTSFTPTALTFGASVYVCAGSNGLASSSDALTWTKQLTTSFNVVVFVNSLFVAVGSNIIETSVNGTTWTSRSTTSASWNAATYDGTNFIAAGAAPSGTGGAIFATSSAGTAWTISAAQNFGPVTGLTVIGGTVVAVGFTMATSADHGVTWTTNYLGYYPGGTSTTSIFSGNILAIGSHYYCLYVGSSAEALATTADGINWYLVNNPQPIIDLAYDGTTNYVAVTADAVCTSTDGVTWSNQRLIGMFSTPTIIYGERFVIANRGQMWNLYTSTDAASWSWINHAGFTFTPPVATIITLSDAPSKWVCNDIQYLNATYYAVGSYGGSATNIVFMLRSTDGVTWTSVTNMGLLPSAYVTTSAIPGGNNFLVFASTTGITSGMFVIGTNIELSTSVSSVTSTTVTLSQDIVDDIPVGQTVMFQANSTAVKNALGGITFDGTTYWATENLQSSINKNMSSADGISWTANTTTNFPEGIVRFNNGYFIASSSSNTLLRYSNDGTNYTPLPQNLIYSSNALPEVVFQDGYYYVIAGSYLYVGPNVPQSVGIAVPLTGTGLISQFLHMRRLNDTLYATGTNMGLMMIKLLK